MLQVCWKCWRRSRNRVATFAILPPAQNVITSVEGRSTVSLQIATIRSLPVQGLQRRLEDESSDLGLGGSGSRRGDGALGWYGSAGLPHGPQERHAALSLMGANKVAAGLLIACFVGIAGAQGVKSGSKVLATGNWTVYRAADAMTDQIRCTGLYKDEGDVQLTPDTLYIATTGGVQSVTLRFDDAPAEQFRLTTKIEKDIRAVAIRGVEFDRAVDSKRLRVQVGTLVSGVKTFDFDMMGVWDAASYIRRSCESGVVAVREVPDAPVACPNEVKDRMAKIGIDRSQITQVCR